MTEHVRVEVTAGSRAGAASLAEPVVAARLAACAQVSGPIASSYRWRGAVRTDEAEIVAVPVVGGDPEYLAWVTAETRTEEAR
jgi:periplasmic divalent cation tolerance protein